VRSEESPLFHSLLTEFDRLTGCPVLVNTSFNVRGEPIACTPAHAYACFMRTNMDALAIEGFLMDKADQPPFEGGRSGPGDFPLD
jgi:carbamoyltransferase